MTKSQKLALKVSDLRARLHQKMRDYDAITAPDALSAEPSPEARAAHGVALSTYTADRARMQGEISAASDTIIACDAEWRTEVEAEDAAALAAAASAPRDGVSAEVRELQAVEDRASLMVSIRQALGDDPLAGAEKELREALGLSAQMLPWNVFVPPPSERDVEERVDANVTTPTTIQSYQNSIVRRVFTGSALDFLGVMPRMVGVGDQLHMVLTAGGVPGFVAKGAGNDYPDATISTNTTSPKRLQTGYRVAKRDIYRVSGLEPTLRDDMGRSMSDRVNYEVLNGAGGNGITGFLHALAAPHRAGLPDSFDSAVPKLNGALDGLYARKFKQIKTALAPRDGRHLAGQFRGDGNMSATDYMDMRLGGMFVSANMPAGAQRVARHSALINGALALGATTLVVDGTNRDDYRAGDVLTIAGVVGSYELATRTSATDWIIARVDDGSRAGLGTAAANNAAVSRAAVHATDALQCKSGPGVTDNTVLDIWQGVMLTRDNVTDAKEGLIRLILDMFLDFKLLRALGFERLNLNSPA